MLTIGGYNFFMGSPATSQIYSARTSPAPSWDVASAVLAPEKVQLLRSPAAVTELTNQ